jgi:hypothetical protein
VSTTATRILIVFGSTVGAMAGVFVAMVKLAPERAKLILGYQVEAIELLQKENKRQAEIIARLELRVQELENHR